MVPVLKEGNKNIYRINKKDNRRRVGGDHSFLVIFVIRDQAFFQPHTKTGSNRNNSECVLNTYAAATTAT